MGAEASWCALQSSLLNLRSVRQVFFLRKSPEHEEEMIFDPNMANGVSNKKKLQKIRGF